MCSCAYLCIRVCIYVRVYACMCVRLCVCMYVCMNKDVYVSMHVTELVKQEHIKLKAILSFNSDDAEIQ